MIEKTEAKHMRASQCDPIQAGKIWPDLLVADCANLGAYSKKILIFLQANPPGRAEIPTRLSKKGGTPSIFNLSVDRFDVAAAGSLPSATAITADSATKMTENLASILERLRCAVKNSTLIPLMYFAWDI